MRKQSELEKNTNSLNDICPSGRCKLIECAERSYLNCYLCGKQDGVDIALECENEPEDPREHENERFD